MCERMGGEFTCVWEDGRCVYMCTCEDGRCVYMCVCVRMGGGVHVCV